VRRLVKCPRPGSISGNLGRLGLVIGRGGFRTLVLIGGIRSASSGEMPTARLNLRQPRPPRIGHRSRRFGKRRHSSSDSLEPDSADTVRRTHWNRTPQTQFVGLTGFGRRRLSSSDSLDSAGADSVRQTHWIRQAQTQFVGLTGTGLRRLSSSDSLDSAGADSVRRTHWIRQAQTQFVGLTGTGLRRHSSSNSLPSRRGDLVELNLRRKILTRPRLSPACVMVPVIALANPEDRIRVAPAGTPAQHEASLD